jgi:UDP-2,3-diacylglucosamine pyrophosphatase LpxH
MPWRKNTGAKPIANDLKDLAAALGPAEAAVVSPHPVRRYRAIWISDIHLGWRACEAERLLDFLKHHDADYWYLVGDIVDGWLLKRFWYWPQAHNDVVQKLLRKVRKGAQVVCIPGNHDEFLREFAALSFGGILILPDAMHTTADGRRLWILHGDAFDSIVHYAPWLAILGNNGYDLMILVGRALNRLRRGLGFPDWSLSAYVKQRVKNVVKFITNYECAIAREARRRGADGVVCGHIHKAEIKQVDGLNYCNTGDWVESCTAVVEHFDGRMALVEWAKTPDVSAAEPIAPGA